MQILFPVTRGQLSFLLGIVPIFAAWIYAEYLEYKKNNTLAKALSDIGLVELGNEAVKEDDDRAVLLEGGGGLQSASPKARTSTSSFPIFRHTS
uniref:Uncharacterized protein n=1 Tax=Salix viminalis TaxID=40686 RepID=A0A6N2MVU3_SALVM